MPSPTPSLAPSPKRRVLHERSQSQTNQLPTSSVRLVPEKHLDLETGVYSVTPYPTKPEHVLLPTAGNTLGVGFNPGHTVSDPYLDPTTGSSSSLGLDRRHSTPGDVFDRSSTTFLPGDSSSLAWDDDPNSSKTSIPHSETPVPISGAAGYTEEIEEKDLGEDDERSDTSSIIALPATIKTVPPETSSPSTVAADPSRVDSASDGSSPNFVPLGATSSPNFVPLRSSSPNFVAVGSSSPNFVRVRASNSSLYSPDSVGTTRRYPQAGQRHRTPSGGEASDRSSLSSSDLYPSSPPGPVLRSFQSASSFALPPPGSVVVRPGSSSTSGHSDPSLVDAQAIVRSGVTVQYPTIRSASSSSLRANSLPPRTASSTSAQSITDHSSERWQPHLSIVPSEWTPEFLPSNPSAPPQGEDQLSGPNSASRAPGSRASIWVVDQSEAEESSDNLTQLRTLPLRGKASGSLRSQPSNSRLNSLKRTVSGASTISNAIPAWARTFYLTGGRDLLVFSPSFFDPSRPNTPLEARPISRPPLMEISRPRTRPHQNSRPSPPALPINPTDPRSHWAGGPHADQITPATSVTEDPATWSPHLHQDKRAGPVRQSVWKAPSLDESQENLLTKRNAQIYSFALGFVCPLVWFIASFLPLPSRPSHVAEKSTTSKPDIEQAFHDPVALAHEVRYENARWWRNVNRCMTPLGLAIIVVIIVLSVLGTRPNGL